MPATSALATAMPAATPAAINLCTTCGECPRLGSLSRCIVCLRADAERDRRDREAAQARSRPDAVKRCRTCRRDKPASSFAVHRRAHDGRRRDCRSCVTAGRVQRKQRTAKELRVERERKADPRHRVANTVAVKAWAERNRAAVACKKKLKRALRRGDVVRAPHCQAAGCTRRLVEAHHHSYDRPTEVLWVCRSHHRRGHVTGVIHVADGIPRKLGRVPRSS